ncbi:hypothetical protein CVT24_008194 [Panaeolus cyanescens]|uniref:Uncharacterized protein n=1 Tax=Panaeolus cyanescens TaxID=181874 RepID=A0A409W0D2_9AGAR|nr:hypothetical protein CVT24_008194 [Panaeolus cyanescens]
MVISLVSICLLALSNYPQHANLLPTPLYLRDNSTINDIIHHLNPTLWLTLIQVFHNLPRYLSNYSLSFNHPDLELSQSISSTKNFALISILDLSACQQLSDTTITRLKILHNLIALNLSQTSITHIAIRNLTQSLSVDAQRSPIGPWSLRLLSLRNCPNVADSVFPELVKFPLLTVIDLRGTRCTPSSSFPFGSCTVDEFYHPTSLEDSIKHLHGSFPDTFSSSNVYYLNITDWEPTKAPNKVIVASENAFAVFPSNPQDKITTGNTLRLQMHEQAESAMQHQDDWYKRQEPKAPALLASSLFLNRKHRSSISALRRIPNNDLPPIPNTTATQSKRPNRHSPTSSSSVPPVSRPDTQAVAVDAFYQRKHVVPSTSPLESLKAVHKPRVFESLSDAKRRHLKLFREPPLRSVMGAAIQKIITDRERPLQEIEQKKRHREEIKAGKQKAVFDWDGHRALDIRRKMEETLTTMTTSDGRAPKKRRISDQPMPSFDYGDQPLVPKAKKVNPFRRHSDAFSSRSNANISNPEEDEEIDGGIKSDDDNVRGGALRFVQNRGPTSSKPSDKPLKPISSIPVPILTPEMQREEWAKEAKALGITVDELKRIGFGWTPDRNNSRASDSSKRDSGATLSRFMAVESKDTRLDKRSGATNTEENKRRKSTPSSSKGKTGFDWDNWGKQK